MIILLSVFTGLLEDFYFIKRKKILKEVDKILDTTGKVTRFSLMRGEWGEGWNESPQLAKNLLTPLPPTYKSHCFYFIFVLTLYFTL